MDSSLSSVPPVGPKPRPRNHRNVEATTSQQRREHQRHLIADPASGMLVNFGHGRRPSQRRAAAEHGVGSGRGFVRVHSAEVDCHGECGHLIVGNLTARKAFHEGRNLIGRQTTSVAFSGDDLRGIQVNTCSELMCRQNWLASLAISG